MRKFGVIRLIGNYSRDFGEIKLTFARPIDATLRLKWKLAFMLKKVHGDKNLRSYFTSQKTKKSQTDISELVEATANVTASDALAVNAELGSFTKEKGKNGFL